MKPLLTPEQVTRINAILVDLDYAKELIVRRVNCGEDCAHDMAQVTDLATRLLAYRDNFGGLA